MSTDHPFAPTGETGPGWEDMPTAPHDADAERNVLGTFFLEPEMAVDIASTLEPGDFYVAAHRAVAEALWAMHDAGETIDAVTLTRRLRDAGRFEQAGGMVGLGALLNRQGYATDDHCEIIADLALLRQIATECDSLGRLARSSGAIASEVREELDRRVMRLFDRSSGINQLRPAAEVLRESLAQMEAASESGSDGLQGVPTGFKDIDHVLWGLRPGDLVIVGARPAMGKTSFCLNVASNAALAGGGPVAFFSLEMPSSQLCDRWLASEGRIDLTRIRSGKLTDEDWANLPAAVDKLSKAPVFFDDRGGIKPSHVRSACRQLKRRHGLGMIVVDYLQLLEGRGSNETARTADVSKQLKFIAKELQVPLVALAQLNRGVESRTDKRPLMSDLRQSGQIEQDADVVLFLYRDEVYKKDLPEDERGIAEVIVAKHRNGALGTVKLKFWGEWTRFESLETRMVPWGQM